MDGFEIRVAKNDLGVMTWRNMVVGVWYEKPTMESVASLAAVYRAMADKYPTGLVVCIIVEDGITLPDQAARKAIADAMKSVEHSVSAMCGTQEATGFLGAAIRSVILGMVLMSRVPYKTGTVATVKQGADWLAPFVIPESSPQQIASTIHEFRTKLNKGKTASKN